MHWLLAVLIGHFLNAISYVLDKVLLTKSITNPYAFTFFIGILGLLGIVLIPFGFEIPEGKLIALNLITGALYIGALLFFFLALKGAEASRIVPFIGGGIPLFTWIFELLFLDERLTGGTLLAFGILVVGTIVIAIEVGGDSEKKEKQGVKAWLFGSGAAVLFAISFGLTKIAYDAQPFFSAFVWQRFGSFAIALVFLLWASHRKAIKESMSIFKEKAGLYYIIAQAFGAGGFIFVNYAISLASVSLVNALQGVQYAFLLVMAVVASVKWPKLLQEAMTHKSLVVKIIGVIIISIGLYLVSQSALNG
ncbi:MAG: EamA family transporter [Candidatus Kerfeldbacteria bacterium]